LAVKAYIMGLAPVSNQVPEDKLKFPYNQRVLMIGWNMFNNSDHRFEPDAKQSAEWNRGAYVTEALGHCQQCHTSRNFMQGLKTSKAYDGAPIQGWQAYNITSDKTAGIGGWSDADLASYLSTGHADGHGSASGPMAEAIENSLRYLTPDDIKAMVTYLKTIPPQPGNAAPASASATAKPDVALGGKIFEEACQSCHRANGDALRGVARQPERHGPKRHQSGGGIALWQPHRHRDRGQGHAGICAWLYRCRTSGRRQLHDRAVRQG
jgi:mono/diheme cytochrome c family protein